MLVALAEKGDRAQDGRSKKLNSPSRVSRGSCSDTRAGNSQYSIHLPYELHTNIDSRLSHRATKLSNHLARVVSADKQYHLRRTLKSSGMLSSLLRGSPRSASFGVALEPG